MSRGLCLLIGAWLCLPFSGTVLAAEGEEPNSTPDVNFPSWPPDPNFIFPATPPKAEVEEKERHTSALNAASFCRFSRYLYTRDGAGVHDERMALVFVRAALELDPFAGFALRDYLYLKTHLNEREDWMQMRRLLISYLDRRPEIEVARAMVRYLLEDLDSREQREQMLADVYRLTTDRDKELASDVVTELAILTAERGDVRGAVGGFAAAYRMNPYNELACAKLAEAGRGELSPTFYISQARLAIIRDPLDLHGALAFATRAETQGVYGVAAKAYKYSADLHKYLYPDRAVPAEICRPWSLSCYNQFGKVEECIDIAELVRSSGEFDAVIEGIALKAAEKQGMAEKAKEISARVEARLAEMAAGTGQVTARAAERAAWYYAFAAKESGKALSWANKAYAADPNSQMSRSLLVYALVINGQAEVASEMVNDQSRQGEAQTDGDGDQITNLAMAMKLLEEQKKDEALAMLKKVVQSRPDSIEAAEAKDLLAYNGENFSGIDEKTVEDTLSELKVIYGEDVMPDWMSPGKMLSIKLLSRMDEQPSFDADLKLELSITNNWSGPLMVGEGALFRGAVRVDGEFAGDVHRVMPRLVERQIGRWSTLEAGKSIVWPLDMNVAGVYETLRQYPQANLNITFTAYLDAVEQHGEIRNAVSELSPGSVTMERRGVLPTREFVASRLETLAKGSQMQKVYAIRLFASLLREGRAAEEGRVSYKVTELEPALLKSAIMRGLDDDDETVKVQTMVSIAGLPMDYDLTNAVAEGLQSKYWPTKVMSLYLLGRTQGADFDKVLKWYIENEKDQNVRKMAETLLKSRESGNPA